MEFVNVSHGKPTRLRNTARNTVSVMITPAATMKISSVEVRKNLPVSYCCKILYFGQPVF